MHLPLHRPWFAPLSAAALTAVASAPGLRLPLLSDDWTQFLAVTEGLPLRTPFGDFRPLYMASLWLDYRLFGANPVALHGINLLMLCGCAWLAIRLLQRLGAGAELSCPAGVLFALQPYHVENAAWIAARSEPLFVLFLLGAAHAFLGWAAQDHGLPWRALLLFELALLSKETALVFPFLALLWAALSPSFRSRRIGVWARGVLSPFVVLALHALLRWAVLEGAGRTLLESAGPRWGLNLCAYTGASLIPIPTEWGLASPIAWLGSAALAAIGLIAAAWHRGGLTRAFGASALAFPLLLGPSIVGLQERYMLLPSIASAVGLAALLAALPTTARRIATVTLLLGWTACSVVFWSNWTAAGRAARQLPDDVAALCAEPGTDRLIVVNMPYFVRGGSVAGRLEDAVRLLLPESTACAVRPVAFFSLAAADDDGLTVAVAPGETTGALDVELRLETTPFRRFVGPQPPEGQSSRSIQYGRLHVADDAVRIELDPLPAGTRAVGWSDGRLRALR